jgi:hypothetical protein
MTAAEVIAEIERLPREEKAKILDYARHALSTAPKLTPEQADALAERMVATRDRNEARKLQDEIVRGFYGGEPHA